MANFIERTLEPGERVILQGRLHWTYNVRYTVIGVILMIGALCGFIFTPSDGENTNTWYVIYTVMIFLSLFLVWLGYFLRSRTEFAVTDTRFIQKDGIFDIKMTEIPLFKIETINFYQSLSERMFGTGSIELVGSGGTNHRVEYLQDPYGVRNQIATLMKEKHNESAPVNLPNADNKE